VSLELRHRGLSFLSSTDLLQAAIMAITTTSESRTTVRGLGEIALRVNDLGCHAEFYEDVIRLPLMTRVPNCAFFRIADGYGGHTQVLGLFDRSNGLGYRAPDAPTSTVDHIAFGIPSFRFRKRIEKAEGAGTTGRNR